jgi:membrane protease YdiL (CAAX protease family)
MKLDKKYTVLFKASLCSIALMFFSFFIHFEFPLKLIALFPLILVSYLFSLQFQTLPYLRKKPIGSGILITLFLFSLSGIICGTLLALLYRWHLGIGLFPESFHYFVIVAALIGAVEELVFRGFIQEQVESINGPFSVFFSTMSHTGYKICLFLAPVTAPGINLIFLAFWTFLIGLLFGTVRHLTKSLIPSLIAHAVFDMLVYAEFFRAPWWVW